MKTYVQILDSVVINVVSLSDDDMKETLKHEYIGDFADITNTSPAPVEGWFYDATTQTFSTPDLADLRTAHNAEIDYRASNLRKSLSPYSSQIEIYKLKAIEADQYLASPTPSDLTAYPWIQIDVTVTGSTADEVAVIIKNKSDDLISKFQAIELERRVGKVNVTDAVTYAEILLASENAMQALDNI